MDRIIVLLGLPKRPLFSSEGKILMPTSWRKFQNLLVTLEDKDFIVNYSRTIDYEKEFLRK